MPTQLNRVVFIGTGLIVLSIGVALAAGYGPEWLRTLFWPESPSLSNNTQRRRRAIASAPGVAAFALMLAALVATLELSLHHV
jgi:hypothetical protein